MAMVTEYPPIRIISPAGFDPGTAQTPGSVRLAAVAPQLGIQSALWGGLFEVKPGARMGHPSSWRAADDRLCLVGHLRSPLGREGRIRCARESRRFHPCACLPAAHGDQSVGFGAFSLGGREEHPNADRGEPSGLYVAIGNSCCGTATAPAGYSPPDHAQAV